MAAEANLYPESSLAERITQLVDCHKQFSNVICKSWLKFSPKHCFIQSYANPHPESSMTEMITEQVNWKNYHSSCPVSVDEFFQALLCS